MTKTTTRNDNGTWVHTFRQSQIQTADQCLEKFRRDTHGLMPTIETDAASMGTAVHAAIELCLQHHINGDALPDQETLVDAYQTAFTYQMGLEGFTWVKYDEAKCRNLGARLVRHWYQEILPSLNPIYLEWDFRERLHVDEDREIWLTGTIDCLDKTWGLIDWKTSGSGSKNRGPYQEWEYRRWAIQPTVYTWAAHQHGFPADRFTYCVLHEHGVQTFEVKRGPDHWAWLKDKALALAILCEAELEVLPKTDTSALCGPKWCSAYSSCKGLHVNDF